MSTLYTEPDWNTVTSLTLIDSSFFRSNFVNGIDISFALISILRRHFYRSSRIHNQFIRHLKWDNTSENTNLIIEPGFRRDEYLKEIEVDSREISIPSVWISLGDCQDLNISRIGDKNFQVNAGNDITGISRSSLYQTLIFYKGIIIIDIESNTYLETQGLSEEIALLFRLFHLQIQRDLNLWSFNVIKINDTKFDNKLKRFVNQVVCGYIIKVEGRIVKLYDFI